MHGHLAPGGRILLSFGTSGDLDHAHDLCDRAGMRRETVGERELDRDGLRVRYVAYRLTRAR